VKVTGGAGLALWDRALVPERANYQRPLSVSGTRD